MHPPASCDSAVGSSPGRAILERSTCVRVGARVAIALGLVCFGLGGLWAVTPQQQPRKPIVDGSAPVVPGKLSIDPSGVTLAANQTQRFAVTDANGKSVAVRWTVSELGCSGSSCGMIDDDGNYLAPYSVPHALVVVVEGTLVSDSTHSILAQIQLAPGAIAKPRAVVTYGDGQLTIDAEDTTLASVLELVAEKTGAVIDVPAGSGLERIVEHVGPGQVKDVLTQLFNGSHFNFIIVNSPEHPDGPTRVLLSLRGKDAENIVSVPPSESAAQAQSTPADVAASVPALPARLDDSSMPPKEPLTPEALSELMRERARELREKAQKQ
jgi:hypothetical protein